MEKEKYLKMCQDYAFSKKGICLSLTYIDTHKKLLWKCEFDHIWDASAANVKSGKWCPTCSKNKKLSIEDCILFANIKDGYCLSTEYLNSATPIMWKCKYGHIWRANFNNVKSKGSWCPECSTNIGERICRLFFESFFEKPFNKFKPEWLLTSIGSKLELDGFNKSLGLAFEYQGDQHYIVDNFFIKNESQLLKRKEKDDLKKKLCADNNIVLIEIKQFVNLTDIDYISKILISLLNQYGFKTNKKINIDLKQLYSNKIEKYKMLAVARNGICISEVYIDHYTKLTWQCVFGHVWNAIGYSIEKGHWCPDCAGNKKGKKYSSLDS